MTIKTFYNSITHTEVYMTMDKLNKMLFLHGRGWKEQNYSYDSFKNIIKSPIKDGRIMLNLPSDENRIAELSDNEGLTADDFDSMRGFFIDIDPPKSVKSMINENFDWKTWHGRVKQKIDDIQELFEKDFRKQPTMIYGSGGGIHIVFLFNKPIKKKALIGSGEQKIATIFRYVEMNMPEWDVDKQIYDAKEEGGLFSRIILKKMRIPAKGNTVSKGKFVDDKWKTSYKTTMQNVVIDGSFWDIKEFVPEKLEELSKGALSYQNNNISKERKEAINRLSKIFLDQGGKQGNGKINRLHCISSSHMDKSPSAVFFQDNGIFYCSGCGLTLKLQDVYSAVTGEDLELAPLSCNFKDLAEYLDKYSKQEGDVGETADMLFHFKLPLKESSFWLSEWEEKALRTWCAMNMVKGFNPKLRQPVLEKLINKCELGQVNKVKLVKAGFYVDKIILSDSFSFMRKKGQKEYVRTSAYSAQHPIPVKWEESESVEDVVSLMKVVNNDKYNCTVFSFVFLSLLAPYFEEDFSFHPYVYLYGQKDKGKSAIVALAQSIITDRYESLLYGSANTEHVFVSSLINWSYMPVLIDEIKSILEKDSLVQNIKAMATNGGMIRKGKPGKDLFDTYLAKANMFITSEFRIRQDPSFFQRGIEINMNDFNVDTSKAIKFNKLLRTNKTALLWEIIKFMGDKFIDFYQLETELEKKRDFCCLEAKKRMGALLYCGCLKASCAFMNSIGWSVDADLFINEYLRNEVLNNAPDERRNDIIDMIFNFLGKQRNYFTTILQRMAVKVAKDKESITVHLTNKVLIELGWRNQHELGEFLSEPKSVRSFYKYPFKANFKMFIKTDNKDMLGAILMLLINMRDSFQDTNDIAYQELRDVIIDIDWIYRQKNGGSMFINEFGRTATEEVNL